MAEKIWTKDAEREQLRKIAELIEETDADSYIRMAFCGCVKLAEENIEYDFGNSFPDMLDFRAKQIAEMTEEIVNLREEKQKAEAEYAQEIEAHNNCKQILTETQDELDVISQFAEGLGERIDDMEKEMVMIKAELKQYIRGDIVAEIRTDELNRVIIERGIYGEFLVGTQQHISKSGSCPWAYMQNGWKWKDWELFYDEDDAKKRFVEIVRIERSKERDLHD